MLQPAELTAADIPPVKEFMTAMQRDGTTLCAKEVFTELLCTHQAKHHASPMHRRIRRIHLLLLITKTRPSSTM